MSSSSSSDQVGRPRPLTIIMAVIVAGLLLVAFWPRTIVETMLPSTNAIFHLRVIRTALITYAHHNNGRYATMRELVSFGLLDEQFASEVPQYSFEIVLVGDGFVASATPVSKDAARFGYYMEADGAIRYQKEASSRCMPCFPEGRAGEILQ